MTTTIELINFDNSEYFNASDLFIKDPAYFYGCNNNPRNILNKKKIDSKNYIWAYKKKGEWTASSKSYARSKLLLVSEWVFDNIPLFAKNNKAKYEVDPAPPLLELDEKFKDCNGNILDIETRGEREFDKIYFSVKDVSKCFEMDNLQIIILDKKKGGYKPDIDYKYFTIKKKNNSLKIKVKKQLYFTYNGLIRCLYVSRNKHAEKFQQWASKILFTVQLGTKEQKIELSSRLLGVEARAVKEVFKTSSTTIPCVYLFSINTVKKLRKSMKIAENYTDDCVVYKFGFTNDIKRRTSEHMKTYGQIKGAALKLKYYSYIDTQFISKGEAALNDFFINAIGCKIEYKQYTELIILKPSLLKTVKRQYAQLSNAYAGHCKDLIKQVEDEKNKNKLLKQQNELNIKTHHVELLKKDNELLKKDNENKILLKDLEIQQLKYQILSSK
jgi:hypothetical protein